MDLQNIMRNLYRGRRQFAVLSLLEQASLDIAFEKSVCGYAEENEFEFDYIFSDGGGIGKSVIVAPCKEIGDKIIHAEKKMFELFNKYFKKKLCIGKCYKISLFTYKSCCSDCRKEVVKFAEGLQGYCRKVEFSIEYVEMYLKPGESEEELSEESKNAFNEFLALSNMSHIRVRQTTLETAFFAEWSFFYKDTTGSGTTRKNYVDMSSVIRPACVKGRFCKNWVMYVPGRTKLFIFPLLITLPPALQTNHKGAKTKIQEDGEEGGPLHFSILGTDVEVKPFVLLPSLEGAFIKMPIHSSGCTMSKDEVKKGTKQIIINGECIALKDSLPFGGYVLDVKPLELASGFEENFIEYMANNKEDPCTRNIL